MELRDALQQCRERLAKHRKSGQRIGEQNTKAMLIEPVLAALGWDLYDPDEVNREYRRRSRDNPVDYALLLMRTPRLFVEAKGLGENINDPRWANQVISYAAVAGVEWVALTDGAEWRLYNAHAPVPVEDKLFRSVKVDSDGADVVETLALLSTDNMRENRIQELWRGYFIDRQVNLVLNDVFNGSEPPRELVNLVAKRAERLSADDVRSSLLRVRGVFDWPSPEIGPLVARAVPLAEPAHHEAATPFHHEPRQRPLPAAASPTPVGKAKPKVTAQERSFQLRDLIAVGRLTAGPIIARFDGKEWTATLEPNGVIIFEGRRYTSLSGAGQQVKIASRGPSAPASVLATDGWLFWRARDAVAEDVATLKEIRRRAASDRSTWL